MITFYPGPSKVYTQVETYLQDAFQSGILSVNHRSEPFMAMMKNTIESFKQKLNVPSEYEVYFVSSATECWEMIAQSLTLNSSYHIYNGAFGEKWMEYAQKIRPLTKGVKFDYNTTPEVDLLCQLEAQNEVICVTQNETSNATELPANFLSALRKATEKLIAVDATSSLGGIDFNWTDADIWFTSIQKCLGLPAGMGVMVVSPQAIDQAQICNDRNYYNSLLFVRDNFKKYQTHYTPNTLSIYLLGRIMNDIEHIQEISKQTKERAILWYDFLLKNGYELLVKNEQVRSKTVIAVESSPSKISEIKSKSKQAGIMLGNGYGAWKENCFRIANFPAILNEEIYQLKQFLIQQY